MSRSYHQRHPTRHNKKNRFPHPNKNKWKMRPYGLKYFIGYGGEVYFRKLGEVWINITCKRLERIKIDISNIKEY